MDASITDNSWMLSEIENTRGVMHAVVLSSDGLVRVQTPSLSKDMADYVAAQCTGLVSLGISVSNQFGTQPGINRVVVDFSGGVLFVQEAGEGSRLAVVAEDWADPGLIAQQMQAQVNMIGEHTLGTPARHGDE
ncbi:roadblock/LC7 domain-containing protein [Saccharopolyspora rosea]|uniref:Roadblock/LC7 domain-containing protein n=1 Tax=Saccharopolyspora rosea TaxID=524884 RepID=A0ABW3FTV0_9PSEU|nr:roadblock/LC7 domain-containing protein [Saccharopolyspora rosea]